MRLQARVEKALALEAALLDGNEELVAALIAFSAEASLTFPEILFVTSNNKYHVLQELGEGMTSKVFLGREIETQKLVAIKFLMKSHLSKSTSRVADFRREIDI